MADYRIWFRVAEVAPGHFMATAVGAPLQWSPTSPEFSENRFAQTREEAMAACDGMVATLRDRLLLRGHAVTAVERMPD